MIVCGMKKLKLLQRVSCCLLAYHWGWLLAVTQDHSISLSKQNGDCSSSRRWHLWSCIQCAGIIRWMERQGGGWFTPYVWGHACTHCLLVASEVLRRLPSNKTRLEESMQWCWKGWQVGCCMFSSVVVIPCLLAHVKGTGLAIEQRISGSIQNLTETWLLHRSCHDELDLLRLAYRIFTMDRST